MMWIERLPKVELHCHLDGSVPVPVLKRLCLAGNVAIPGDDAEFRKLIEAGEDCGSLTEYLRAFDLPLQCLRTEEAFFTASYETAANAAKEGVCYLELRFAPLLSETSKLPAEGIIEAAAAGLEKAALEQGIHAAFILCGMRHFKEAENFRTLKLAKQYLDRGVCGLDLAGDESAFPNEAFGGMREKGKYRTGSVIWCRTDRTRHCHEGGRKTSGEDCRIRHRRGDVSKQQPPDKGRDGMGRVSVPGIPGQRSECLCQYR